MRLTLRTLLAWLDDTLPPPDVRQIGQQVTDSPFAQKLVERINKVTRRRRLSVPSSGGADGMDPAVVAAYLDNELGADDIAEFEKKCLESDLLLAEVASSHQILSLIGQKAKVPVEARYRMYHLIKGREAVAPKSLPPSIPAEPEPAAALLPPWQPPDIPARSPWERFGPIAAVAGLLLLLTWSAWQITGPTSNGLVDSSVALGNLPAANKPAPAAKEPAKKPEELANTPAPEPEKTESAESKKEEETATDAAKNDRALAPGVLGEVGPLTGIALRYDPDNRRWDRLAAKAPLKSEDLVANLAPFRDPIKLGTLSVDLVGDAEVRVLSPGNGEAGRLDLLQGRIVVHGANPPEPLGLRFGGLSARITPPAGGLLGIERVAHRGSSEGRPLPALKFTLIEGEAKIEVDSGKEKESVSGPATIVWQPPGKLAPKENEPPPAWVSETGPSPLEQEVGRQFARYFKADNPVMATLAEAMDDEQPEVRRLALSAMGTAGGIEMIIPALSTPDKPDTRRAAIAVLRSYEARGPEATKEIHTQLQQSLGDELAGYVRKLLDGYSPKEALEEGTYVQLVKLLKNPDVGIRELALDNLEALSGRDNLQYDPDKPEGPGLAAWQDLLKRKELPPKPAKAAK